MFHFDDYFLISYFVWDIYVCLLMAKDQHGWTMVAHAIASCGIYLLGFGPVRCNMYYMLNIHHNHHIIRSVCDVLRSDLHSIRTQYPILEHTLVYGQGEQIRFKRTRLISVYLLIAS